MFPYSISFIRGVHPSDLDRLLSLGFEASSSLDDYLYDVVSPVALRDVGGGLYACTIDRYHITYQPGSSPARLYITRVQPRLHDLRRYLSEPSYNRICACVMRADARGALYHFHNTAAYRRMSPDERVRFSALVRSEAYAYAN